MRNNDVTPFKNRENSMQMSYGLYRFLFGLFKRTRSKCIPSGLIQAKETSFSSKRKEVKDN